MEFWRVENGAGWGPYSHRAPYFPTQKAHAMPQDDGLKARWFKPFRDIFGFKSRDLLEEWFDKETLTLLHKHGFTVSHYEVSRFNMRSGRSQSIAHRDKLKLVNRFSCLDLDTPLPQRGKKS